MNARVYTISGHLIDRATRVGIGGVTVEAWDRDTRFHDMLGSTVTNSDGAFWITFDPEYFGDYGGDLAPDVFFRVYRDQQLVLDTMDRTGMNVERGLQQVVLEIETSAPPAAGRDRVTTEQSFKVVNFVIQSDFKGVVREQRSKFSMIGSFAGKLLQSGASNFDLEPIKPTATATNSVVGQPTSVAQANLARNQVAVTDVKAYQPGANKESLIALTSAPLRLRADDKVTLYEENGVVRYYSVNKRPKDGSIDAAAVARIDGEVAVLKSSVSDLNAVRSEVAGIKANFDREHAELSGQVASVRTQVDEVAQLKSQLSELRQTSVAKDSEIATLKQEVSRMRETQADFARRVSPEKINQLEERLRRLDRDG
jgi:hypothetical protein